METVQPEVEYITKSENKWLENILSILIPDLEHDMSLVKRKEKKPKKNFKPKQKQEAPKVFSRGPRFRIVSH